MKEKDVNETKKLMIAAVTIAAAAVGLIAGIIWRGPVSGTFSAGSWITFIAFLASLGSVRDTHSNALPMTAFCFSFAAMCVTVFVSAGGM